MPSLPKLPSLQGLPQPSTIGQVKPYKKKPLNIHKMLLSKIQSMKVPGIK